MDTTPVGMEVRRARTALGLTLAQLAERADKPMRTVHGLEAGENRYPSESVLRPIAEALRPETTYRRLALLIYGIDPERDPADEEELALSSA